MEMPSNPSTVSALQSVDRKVDLFFRLHILPILDPVKIHWHFSLSGGKDSFVMAKSVRNWYLRQGLRLTASGFAIDQWGGAATRSIAGQCDWMRVTVVDAKSLTIGRTAYQPGQQAPCRSCSDVRRDVTDELIRFNPITDVKSVNIVARGLHLSDTAISLLWRHAVGRNPFDDMARSGKGRPLVNLSQNTFLAKPLSYVREFESSLYATHEGYIQACCGCPACQFPSRRDIVEESIRELFEGPIWELDVPGVSMLVSHFGVSDIAELSTPGCVQKHYHLPSAFADFMMDRFRSLISKARPEALRELDGERDLDGIGQRRLTTNEPLLEAQFVPMPAIFSGREMSHVERKMVSTLGPFWGQLGLTRDLNARVARLENELFHFARDEKWTHVNPWLTEFYGSGRRKMERTITLVRRVPAV
jgi:tRNA(Ile)-lysidine synthase TilS/MesJ